MHNDDSRGAFTMSLSDDMVMYRSADISDDGLYRYKLERKWGDGDTCLFIMLNPSTADARIDDPTIRRCMGYARQWGYGRLLVGNIFAYRATDPEELKRTPYPEGLRNIQALQDMITEAALVVCAWGDWGYYRDRYLDILQLVGDKGYSLGTTKKGHPKHPLYLRKDLKPVPYVLPDDGWKLLEIRKREKIFVEERRES